MGNVNVVTTIIFEGKGNLRKILMGVLGVIGAKGEQLEQTMQGDSQLSVTTGFVYIQSSNTHQSVTHGRIIFFKSLFNFSEHLHYDYTSS